jgi:methionyl-tRNA formyltransferase
MKIIFLGRKKYSAELLEWTVVQGVTIRAVVTDSQFDSSQTASCAREMGIPVVSMSEAEAIVSQERDIDLVISYLYWLKIKEPLISGPKYGAVNFHPAILPDWKGTAGYNVAILNKLPEWGATAHYIDTDIDTGDIIAQDRFKFDYRAETAQTLEKKTMAVQMALYKKVIADFMGGGIPVGIPQDPNSGVYISRAEMESMKEINLEKDDIDLKIRAFWFPPYDGAYIKTGDRKYTLVNDFILNQLAESDVMFNKT